VALNHPHIVRVHEFDGLELADARSFYVVMDYVEGVLLDEWAAALPPNREGLRRFIRIAFLIARALEAAHACRYLDDAGFETAGVMHGDVKPGNIIVRSDDTPALVDFMMVDVHRAIDPTVRERLSVNDGAITAVFGTPGFMAPEQERDGIVTIRTDVYGLGATLRAAASRLSLPADLTSLFGRMTGSVNLRPHDMGEVARLLSDVARQEGVDSDEMKRVRPPAENRLHRGLLSAIAAFFRPAAISPSSDPVASAPAESGAAQAYLEVPAMFCLRVMTGPHAGAVYALKSARITVGRSEHNDVVLTREPSLSRSHFALNWSAEKRTFVAIDFGAHNPVLINDALLAGSRFLAAGDLLTIGSTQLAFEPAASSRPTR